MIEPHVALRAYLKSIELLFSTAFTEKKKKSKVYYETLGEFEVLGRGFSKGCQSYSQDLTKYRALEKVSHPPLYDSI